MCEKTKEGLVGWCLLFLKTIGMLIGAFAAIVFMDKALNNNHLNWLMFTANIMALSGLTYTEWHSTRAAGLINCFSFLITIIDLICYFF